jgi:ATP-dependent helicase HrpB
MDATIHQLPLFPRLDEIADAFTRERLLLLTAEPGAGKTTLVPWKLLSHHGPGRGKILLLEPRRIAARAAAERIASLLGEDLGRTVGLRTRRETIAGPAARLEVVTEGVMVRIIQNDPSLAEYRAVIFDEFHERNLQAELGLALAWDCRTALRGDLALMVMSATLPADEFRNAFGPWPLLAVPGRSHPVSVEYSPPRANERIEEGAARLAMEAAGKTGTSGDVLVFLPGFREIRRTMDILQGKAGAGTAVRMLHGRLAPEEQRMALRVESDGKRRILLATNVAESSLTIPGIAAVADTGFERRVRFSPRTGMDHWETARISAASAEQRAGRAGRLGPGICLRWWNPSEALAPYSPPEIVEADLAPLALECAAWGARDPYSLTWITAPPESHLRRARGLLERLGLIDAEGVVTPQGKRAAGLGLHPRLGRMVDAVSGDHRFPAAALVAAILEEGEGYGGGSADFGDRIDAWREGTMHADLNRRISDETRRIMRLVTGKNISLKEGDGAALVAGELLLLAYPDRAARRTSPGRYQLAEGRAATITGRFPDAQYIVAPEMDGGIADGRIFSAAPVDKSVVETVLAPFEESTSLRWNGWIPTVMVRKRAGGLLLEERRGNAGPDELRAGALERLHEKGLEALPWSDGSRRLLARCRFVGRRERVAGWPDFSDEALLRDAGDWLVPFGSYGGGAVFTESEVFKALEFRIGYTRRRSLDSEAPESVTLPSGGRRTVDYESGDIPVIAARLQEFFGCAETPVVGGEPVLLHLLSPAGRPVQVTRDLRGFWERTYADVRKELKGRYPKHYWPENPMEAEPTSRAKPRKHGKQPRDR